MPDKNNKEYNIEDILASLDEDENEDDLDSTSILNDLDEQENDDDSMFDSFAKAFIEEAEEDVDILSVLEGLDNEESNNVEDEDDELIATLASDDEENTDDEEDIETLFNNLINAIKDLSDSSKDALAEEPTQILSMLDVEETSDLNVAGLQIDSNGVITDKGHNVNIKRLIIKDSYNGIKVRKLEKIFRGKWDNSPKLEEVVIEGDICIEKSFADCNNLRNFVFKGEDLEILDNNFDRSYLLFSKESNCDYIRFNNNSCYLLSRAASRPMYISVVSGCEVIGCEAFLYAWNQIIDLPRSLKRICASAFSQCKDLETIYLNEGLIRIDEEAFKDCTSLNDITIPSTVKYIGHNAFIGCNNLRKVYISKSTKFEFDTFPSSAELIYK